MILRIFTGRGVLVLLVGCWVPGFCFCFVVFPVKFLHSIRVSLHFEFPVVDRLCLVLARQCRKKKKKKKEKKSKSAVGRNFPRSNGKKMPTRESKSMKVCRIREHKPATYLENRANFLT